MPIDPNRPLAGWSDWTTVSWTSTDAIVYALGVGAGAGGFDAAHDLQFTTENTLGVRQRVLPTFALAKTSLHEAFNSAGTYADKIVDGRRRIEFHRELAAEGAMRQRTRVVALWDKGTSAVIATETEAVDVVDDRPLYTLHSEAFIVGEGGFGGTRGPSAPRNAPPRGAPDHVVEYHTRPEQALIYRLTGERHPLHSDPSVARAAGYERPILHGLCTFGFAGRALLAVVAGSDPASLLSMEGRFCGPVYPGDTLTVSMWAGVGEASFAVHNRARRAVLDQGFATFRQSDEHELVSG